MATLTGQTVASTYDLLLKVEATGIDASTQRLIEDGNATTSALKLSGAGMTSTGTLTVDGVSTLTGAVTVAGALAANGGITCDTNKFIVADTTGNTTIAGTLSVAGIATMSGGMDGVLGGVTPAAITGTTIGGTVITASTNFAGDITGDVTGTASLVAVTDSSAATAFPVVFNDESDALLDDTGAFTYKPSTGTLIATAVTSDLTGNVIGDVKATNGTSTILDSGTDGTDATLAAGVTLADGVTATTQTEGDGSTKVATTAYVDAAGTVLQVVYFDTDDATFTTAATASMVPIAGDVDTLEAAITPAADTNYILIQIMITFGPAYGSRPAFGISRDNPSAQIGSSTKGTGSQRNAIAAHAINFGHSASAISAANVSVQYRDSLSSWTSGAITYTATVSSDGGLYLNRPISVSDSTNVVYGRSSITLTEIKG